MAVMEMLWDDPDLLEEDDEFYDVTDEDYLISEDNERERRADVLLRVRCSGLNEWDFDPEDEW